MEAFLFNFMSFGQGLTGLPRLDSCAQENPDSRFQTIVYTIPPNLKFKTYSRTSKGSSPQVNLWAAIAKYQKLRFIFDPVPSCCTLHQNPSESTIPVLNIFRSQILHQPHCHHPDVHSSHGLLLLWPFLMSTISSKIQIITCLFL